MSWSDLPAAVARAAKRCLLDTLAVGAIGGTTPEAAAVASALGAMGSGQGAASLWGRELRLAPAAAALHNGTAAHALEMDDYGGCGHPGAVVVPAACAAAEHVGAGGRELLLAIAAGYDVSGRVTEGAGGYRRHNDRGWHSTGTCGSFGAAAAAARILGLDGDAFVSALGIAGTFTGGTWAFLTDGAATKRLHPGKAAEAGLVAAFLAASGLRGPRYILEADWGGFLRTYGGDAAAPEAVLDGLGADFHILRTGTKLYACCRGTHGCIDALREILGEPGASPAGVERIVVHGSEQTRRQMGHRRVASVLEAQLSLPYALAVVADSGGAGLDQFRPPRDGDGAIREWMRRVDVVPDLPLAPGEEPSVEVRWRDGRSSLRRVEAVTGSPLRPVGDAELLAKASSLAEAALGPEAGRRLLALAQGVEELADVRPLLALLRTGSAAPPQDR